MKNNIDWQWLNSFLAVTRGGGLSGASRFTDLSVPSLSRHMQQLENALGYSLFHRGARGFTLTSRGEALFRQVQAMGDIAENALEASRLKAQREVRISLGSWTAAFVNERLAENYSVDQDWRPLIISSMDRQDIARGEVDIGVRNHMPEVRSLAYQRFGVVRYGICKATGSDPQEFIGYERPLAPSMLWVENNAPVLLRVSRADLGIPYLKRGHAAMVLPLFIADRIDGVHIVEELSALESHQYLVMHQDRRHEPHIRAAIRALSPLLEEIAAF